MARAIRLLEFVSLDHDTLTEIFEVPEGQKWELLGIVLNLPSNIPAWQWIGQHDWVGTGFGNPWYEKIGTGALGVSRLNGLSEPFLEGDKLNVLWKLQSGTSVETAVCYCWYVEVDPG